MNLPTGAFALLLAATLPSVAIAQSGSLTVDAKSNVFGYGEGTPAPGGGGGGVQAPVVTLNAGTGRTISFSATGGATWGGGPVNGPDGGTFAASTNIPSLGPISGFQGPLSGMLVGVFIESGDISGLTAPGSLSYLSTASYQQGSYAPGLRQVFYIGDGLTGTGSGSSQTFHVPDGASKLVLGIADAWSFAAPAGYYNDNTGGFNVIYQAVPEPAAASLFALGAMALMGAAGMRRRRGFTPGL